MSNNDPLKEKDDVVTKNVEIKITEFTMAREKPYRHFPSLAIEQSSKFPRIRSNTTIPAIELTIKEAEALGKDLNIDIATLYPETYKINNPNAIYNEVAPTSRPMKTYAQIKESLQSLTEDIGPDPLYPQLAEPHSDQFIISSKFTKRYITTRPKREKYSLAVKQRTPNKKKLCRYKKR